MQNLKILELYAEFKNIRALCRITPEIMQYDRMEWKYEKQIVLSVYWGIKCLTYVIAYHALPSLNII